MDELLWESSWCRREPEYSGSPISFALAFLLATNPMLSLSGLFASESFLSCAAAGIAAAASKSAIEILETAAPSQAVPIIRLRRKDPCILIALYPNRRYATCGRDVPGNRPLSSFRECFCGTFEAG